MPGSGVRVPHNPLVLLLAPSSQANERVPKSGSASVQEK
jgi:hypothetical protein